MPLPAPLTAVRRGGERDRGSQACVLSHRALVEEAHKRRLLEDSDSEEDAPAPAPPRLALRPKPTAILDEVSVPAPAECSRDSRERLRMARDPLCVSRPGPCRAAVYPPLLSC